MYKIRPHIDELRSTAIKLVMLGEKLAMDEVTMQSDAKKAELYQVTCVLVRL